MSWWSKLLCSKFSVVRIPAVKIPFKTAVKFPVVKIPPKTAVKIPLVKNPIAKNVYGQKFRDQIFYPQISPNRGTHEVQRRNVNHFWRCWIYLAQSIHCIGLFCRCSIFGSRQQEHCNLNSLQLQIEFPNATVGLATSAWPFYDTRKSCLEVGKSAFSSLQPLQNGGVIFSVCKSRHKNSPFRGKEYVGRKRLRIDYCTKGP